MEIKNVYFGALSTVTAIDYNYNGTIHHTKKVDYILFYHDGKYAVELISDKKYPFDPTRLNIGQQFVNIKDYKMVPLLTYIAQIEKEHNLKLDIKMNTSKRKIIKVVEKIGKELKKQELEEQKVKKINRIKK